MDLHLKDRVIIVTGGARGIGREIAKVLAVEGAWVAILDKNPAKETVSEIEKAGGRAMFHVTELSIAGECQAAVQAVLHKWGRIESLVNNAGVNDGVGLENGDPENFEASLRKNLVHYYMMAHYCLPELKKHKGPIVNIGSKVAVTGQGGTSGYAAANGGRNALTREWALELLPHGIRVNSVIVAECYTPLYEQWLSGFEDPIAKRKEISSKIPLEKRMTEGTEIAAQVAFLLSAKASHTTGQLIYVDGGYTHLDRAIT